MFKQQTIHNLAIPVATAAVIALSGVAHAVTPVQQAEKPVDCKKTPDHERCKGKGY